MVPSPRLRAINEEASVEEAAGLMKRAKIKHLPVLNNGKLVGIITDTDIMFSGPSMLSTIEAVCRPQKKTALQ